MDPNDKMNSANLPPFFAIPDRDAQDPQQSITHELLKLITNDPRDFHRLSERPVSPK